MSRLDCCFPKEFDKLDLMTNDPLGNTKMVGTRGKAYETFRSKGGETPVKLASDIFNEAIGIRLVYVEHIKEPITSLSSECAHNF